MRDVKTRVLLRFGLVPLVLALLFFLPAGTLRFWQAWIYMAVLLPPVLLVVIYFLKKDPGLLERRMRVKEKEKTQDILVKLSSLIYLPGFLLPGFDFRFQWSHVPVGIVLAADGIVFLGYLICFLVMKENSYLSRTVEVDEGQTVVSTGPYSIVRHPMYTGVLLMFLSTPVALGSWWGLIPFLFLPALLILRLRNEEEVLIKNLSGYEDYRKAVPYRLIPFVW